MTVAVIILNYNSAADCRACVADLLQQQGVDLEIVVVDNCSRPDDCAAVENLCREHGLTFIQATKNGGYNAGNNIGLRYAAERGYRYALVANPDMRFPNREYIYTMAAAMDADENVVVAGSDIIGPDGRHQNPMARDGNWTSSFGWIAELLRLKRHRTDTYSFIDGYDYTHECAKLSGSCIMVRLSFLEQMGFFDERVFLYCEEAILSRQVEHARKKMLYLSDTQALHDHHENRKGDPRPRFCHWRNSRIHFLKNHSGDSRIGILLASISMRLYCAVMCTAFTLRNKLKR